MQTTDTTKFVASAVVSELQSSDMYMTVKARLFDLRANLNKVRVTEAFMDEIVANEDKYVCIPLCADVRGLLSNRTIGHMYDAKTGEFHSTQIGAFYQFEKEVVGDNAYLVGYVRIMKRNKAICHALSALFADNALKFSFEITCASYTVDGEETIIDVDPKNFLEGMAVVTFPACEEATAQQLVAECLGKGDENMADTNEMIAETEEVETVTETAETETAEAEVAEVESAERVIVEQVNVEVDSVSMYNCDTGESVEQRTETITRSCTPIEIAEEQEDDAEDEEENNEHVDTTDDENADCKKKKCAEDQPTEVVTEETHTEEIASAEEVVDTEVEEVPAFSAEKAFAELIEKINALQTRIAELEAKPETVVAEESDEAEETVEVVAEQATVEQVAETLVNPFIAEMETPIRYSLLEKREKATSYSLLERA